MADATCPLRRIATRRACTVSGTSWPSVGDVTDVAAIQLVYLMTLHEMLEFNDVANATAGFDDLLLACRDVARCFELVALTSALTETMSPVLASTNCSLTGLPVRALAAQLDPLGPACRRREVDPTNRPSAD